MLASNRPKKVVLLIGFAVIGVGVIVLFQMAPGQKTEAPHAAPTYPADATHAKALMAQTPDQRATQLALHAHSQSATIDKLARFSYHVRYRHAVVDSMRAVDVSFSHLKRALTDRVLDSDWFGWYETGISWDENRFLWEVWPKDADLNYCFRFWTASEAWNRGESKDKSSVDFTRFDGSSALWEPAGHPSGTYIHLFDFSYLRLTPRRFWWGQTKVVNDHTMNAVAPDKATWNHVGTEQFGGEKCDVVESAERREKLWIALESGRIRGVLSHLMAKEPNELVQFDDYRQVSPGVWLPFREVRAFPHLSQIMQRKSLIRRTELIVERVQTDLDLATRYAELLPREGNPVQDQRFAVPVDYAFSAKRTDDEIQRMADVKYKEQLKNQEEFKRVIQSIEVMVGKPAPALPTEGWVGGRRPDVAGKPYLLHFWATSCAPCKNDFQQLNTLAGNGVIIIGMHPSGTPAEEVETVVRDRQLSYPTILSTGKDSNAKSQSICGYPVRVFPYCILVDGEGRVASHGFLTEVLEKAGIDRLTGSRVGDTEKKD